MESIGLSRTKICRLCKEEKLPFDFYSHSNTSDKLRSECKVCWNKASLKYHHQNKDILAPKKKAYYFKSRYNLTLEELEIMKETQRSSCAICKEKYRLVVDHSHTDGRVRKLLCDKCNQGLGSFKDNPDLLLEASNYLRNN